MIKVLAHDGVSPEIEQYPLADDWCVLGQTLVLYRNENKIAEYACGRWVKVFRE